MPEDAHTCPHPGCGKPLSNAAASKAPIRPPPPPRKIQLSASDVTHPASHSAAPPASSRRRSAPLALALLLGALCILLAVALSFVLRRDRGAPGSVAASSTAGANAAGERHTASSPGKDRQTAKQAPAGNGSDAEQGNESERAKPGDMAPDNARQGSPKKPESHEPPPMPEVLGLYSQRTAAKREDWIGQMGGTPGSETAVASGLAWLARHQADDGHWGPDCLGKGAGSKCEPGKPCSGSGGKYEAALTGLAVLAFQAGGHYDFNEHQYSGNVARGLHCLADQQGFNGELVGSLNDVSEGPDHQATRLDRCYMYEHSIATFALAEACAVAKAARRQPNPQLWNAAVKGVRFIESQQHNDGGWRYNNDKRLASDSSVSGWAMLALKTAREAEIEIKPETVPRLVEFFKKVEEPLTGRTHYVAATFTTDALTGVGMMVDEFVNQQTSTQRIHRAAPYLADEAESKWGPRVKPPAIDYYLWYNCTLAMFQAGGEPWKRWNDVTRACILSLQEQAADCTRGSWPPEDRWSHEGGRIYSTALAVLTLEVYYRFAKEHVIGDKPTK
jgi:hypothetical protein